MPESLQSVRSTTSRRSNSKAVVICELALFAMVFAADYYRWHHLIRISKIPYLLLLGWASLRLRGQTWKTVGWGLYRSWGGTFGQGAIGQIENGIGGFFFAVFSLVCGRKLSVPIVAHGVQDTIDVLSIFLGKYPGGL